MNIKEFLNKLTVEELKMLKENPYLIDELIYEKTIEKKENNNNRDYVISVGNSNFQGTKNWLADNNQTKRL